MPDNPGLSDVPVACPADNCDPAGGRSSDSEVISCDSSIKTERRIVCCNSLTFPGQE